MSDGVAFENAISPASRTNPSMAGTFTGEPMVFREPVSNPEISRNHLRRHGTFVKMLGEMGYETAAFNPNAYASRHYGFHHGFDHFEDFLFSEESYQTVFEKHLTDSNLYTTIRNLRNFAKGEEVFRTWESYVDDIEAWVRSRDGDNPFFLWAFSLDTHFPFRTPRRHRNYWSVFDQFYYDWLSNKIIDDLNPDLSDKQWQKLIDIYDDSIRYADLFIGELQERLSDFDPVFVVHSDHGEGFGEHGKFGHFYPDLYEENIHVPMAIWNSDMEPTTVKQPFSLFDLRETVIDLAQEEATSDSLGEPAVLASDYDGRRERNVIVARSRKKKYILEETSEKTTGQFFELTPVPDGQDREAQIEEGPDILRQLAVRQKQHKDEKIGIQRGVENLTQ
jgi:arylsulfatase